MQGEFLGTRYSNILAMMTEMYMKPVTPYGAAINSINAAVTVSCCFCGLLLSWHRDHHVLKHRCQLHTLIRIGVFFASLNQID